MIRMSIKLIFILTALFLLVSSCRHSALSSSDLKPQTQSATAPSSVAEGKAEATEYVPSLKTEGAYVTVKDSNFSFAYKTDEYARVMVTKEEKFVASEPTPPGNYPAYRCFHLKDKRPLPAFEKGPRYFFPAYSKVCIIPLADSKEQNFAKAYPEITEVVNQLREVLSHRPETPLGKIPLPDLPLNNAGRAINSRFQFLDFRSGKGFLLLTQYTQEDQPTPLNNEELTCLFQGVTSDRKYYVSARMAITHSSLPRGIDFTNHIKRDREEMYLREGERRLNALPDDSFQPSLSELKKLLSSIAVE
jgi:hypothetical protein